jgi:telomerase reverse transcriptase
VEKPAVDVWLDSMEESVEITQNEISTISTLPSSDGLLPVSKEQDIIRHYTPQYKVFNALRSSSQVIAFVRAVIKNLIPRDLLGSEHNMAVVLAGRLGIFLTVGAEKIVDMRRYENISLHAVMNGIKLTDISWLAPPNSSSTTKLSLTDTKKRTELLAEFIYWLFDAVIIHVIRTNFYVTETAVHKNQVFYFRHDIWRDVSLPSVAKLKETMLEEVPTVRAI